MQSPGVNRIGTTRRLTASFEDENSLPVDPTTVIAKTYSPSGAITDYTYGSSANVGRTAVGHFYLDMTPNEAGRWFIRWEGTQAAGALVLEDDFIVQTSPFIGGVARAYS